MGAIAYGRTFGDSEFPARIASKRSGGGTVQGVPAVSAGFTAPWLLWLGLPEHPWQESPACFLKGLSTYRRPSRNSSAPISATNPASPI